MKSKHLIWFILAAVGYVMALVFGMRGEEEGKARQAELEEMFRAIRPMPGANVLSHSASHKSRQCLVESTYSGNISWPEIRAYYDAELSRHGWRFVGEISVRVWDKDFGGREAHYVKGSYRANVDYAGDKKREDWSYVLAFSFD